MTQPDPAAWFDAEDAAAAAVISARAESDFKGLAESVELLADARDHRGKAARNGKRVVVLDDAEALEAINEPGRYMLRPPLVGRDARDMAITARQRRLPVLFLCREPRTQLGQCPVVALGLGVTVRIQVDEPDDPDAPSCPWFDAAASSLGQRAIDMVDETMPTLRRLDALLAALTAVPDHLGLHEAIVDAAAAADE